MDRIMFVNELLSLNLNIPGYQRPYKWSTKNIQELLNDISNAIDESKKYSQGFRYRIGTIILHKNDDGKYDIIDGQQRIISLILLYMYLVPDFNCSLLNLQFNNRTTQSNIHDNYTFIREWFSLRSNKAEDYKKAFSDVLQVVTLYVDKLSEAFQLFDSQNTRGKALDPHDLLKAYHLREMKSYPYEMTHAVTKWEAKDTTAIRDLFNLYLFPIWNWSYGNKSGTFTTNDIDIYKGIQEDSTYTYARRANKAMPHFQITEPFIAGKDFFEMVDHYILLLYDITEEIKTNDSFTQMKMILEKNKDNKNKIEIDRGSAGFQNAKNLFYCALLCYYDRFHNFDEMAVKKLFVWAFMIRIDMEKLGDDTINKYAVGEFNNRYTNTIAMFSKIRFARLHTEISGLQIKLAKKATEEKWNALFNELKIILGIAEVSNE